MLAWKNKHPKNDRWILNSAWFLNCSKVVGPCGLVAYTNSGMAVLSFCFSLRPGTPMRCCRKDLWSKIWDVVATSQRTTEAMIPKCLGRKKVEHGEVTELVQDVFGSFFRCYLLDVIMIFFHDSSWRFISHSQPRQSQRLCTSCCWSTWGLSQKMEPWRSLSSGHDV